MQAYLEAAGLSQYVDVFLREGFDDIEILRKRARKDGSALAKELSEDLSIPKGHARKLVWHLEGMDGVDPERKQEVKREIKEEEVLHPAVVQAPPAEQTHYEVLQVDVTASSAQIRRAYLKLVVLRHPDKPGGTTAGFQRLEAAYDILSDGERRKEYDNNIGANRTAHIHYQQDAAVQYDLHSLWLSMLRAGCGSWMPWLEALPTAALAGLQQLTHGKSTSAAPALTQALVAGGSYQRLTTVQLDAELHCGRDILRGFMASNEPKRSLVEELVAAIRPAAMRVCSREAMDAQLLSSTLEQLFKKLLHRTKWAGRYGSTLSNSMPDLTQAYIALVGLSLDPLIRVPPASGTGAATSEPQEPAKKQNGHYYRSGKGWMTKVVIKGVHLTSVSSRSLEQVAGARASLTQVKRLTEAAIQAGVDFPQALHGAVAATRPECLAPLVWQYSFDTRELVQGGGMTPTTPVLEEMLQHREELVLRVRGPLGSRLTGSDLKGLCNDMRQKRKELEQSEGEERLEKARARLAKLVKQELDSRKLAVAPMIGACAEDLDEQKATIPARRRAADKLAARFLHEEGKITTDQVLAVLAEWGFEENMSRQNVMPRGRTYIFSDTLGAVRTRSGTVQLTQPTAQYPHVSRLICRHVRQSMDMEIPHTSICMNKGYSSRKHRDSGNEGPSAIKAFGEHHGGELLYWPRDLEKGPLPASEAEATLLDLRTWTIFNGNKAHGTKAYRGVRYSIVLFTVKGFETLQGHQKNLLTEAGYNVSSPASVARFKAALAISDHSAFHVAGHAQQAAATRKRDAETDGETSESKKAKTALNLPAGVLPLSGKATAWNLPPGWQCGFKMTSTNKKVKVAVGPCGRVFWDLRQARRAYPGALL